MFCLKSFSIIDDNETSENVLDHTTIIEYVHMIFFLSQTEQNVKILPQRAESTLKDIHTLFLFRFSISFDCCIATCEQEGLPLPTWVYISILCWNRGREGILTKQKIQ